MVGVSGRRGTRGGGCARHRTRSRARRGSRDDACDVSRASGSRGWAIDSDVRSRSGGRWTDLRTVCASRTCLRTFAANLGSPLEATDFSRSVTFSKSCVGRRERGGGSAKERQRPAATSRERARSVRAKPDPGAPNRLCTLPTSGDSRGTHHIQHVLRGDGRLLLHRLLLILVRPVFHLHVRAHVADGRACRGVTSPRPKTCATWFKRADRLTMSL